MERGPIYVGGAFLDKGGNSSYGQREPDVISTDLIGRFRQVLPKGEIAVVQARARQEMPASDYQLESIQFAFSERLSYMFANWPRNLARVIGWRALNALQNRKGRPVPSFQIVPEASST